MDSNLPPLEPLARLVELLVARDYEGAADLTHSDRLQAHEMRLAVEEYGRTLTSIPSDGWGLVDAVAITSPVEGKEWSIDLPLWTIEEGRSDLQVRTMIRAHPDARVTIRLDDILVP